MSSCRRMRPARRTPRRPMPRSSLGAAAVLPGTVHPRRRGARRSCRWTSGRCKRQRVTRPRVRGRSRCSAGASLVHLSMSASRRALEMTISVRCAAPRLRMRLRSMVRCGSWGTVVSRADHPREFTSDCPAGGDTLMQYGSRVYIRDLDNSPSRASCVICDGDAALPSDAANTGWSSGVRSAERTSRTIQRTPRASEAEAAGRFPVRVVRLHLLRPTRAGILSPRPDRWHRVPREHPRSRCTPGSVDRALRPWRRRRADPDPQRGSALSTCRARR
jgi:hypothetical protein